MADTNQNVDLLVNIIDAQYQVRPWRYRSPFPETRLSVEGRQHFAH